MQRVTLEIPHSNFFCPVTGVQILSPDSFNPSPAMLFCYVEGSFEHSQDFVETLYEQCEDELKWRRGVSAFDLLVDVKLKDENNYVLFNIYQRGMGYGPVCMVSHIAIDMNYAASEDGDGELIDMLPSFEGLEVLLVQANEQRPQKNGIAIFSRDSVGVGVFHFCATVEEWRELYFAFLVLDHLAGGEISLMESSQFSSAVDCYMEYFETTSWNESDYASFMQDANQILEDFRIEYAGPVTDLFNPENPFSAELMERFGKSPEDHESEYLDFLGEFMEG
jgi:hypothetical protein